MTDYDGYYIVGPTFSPFSLGLTRDLDEIDITIPDYTGFQITVGTADALDEIDITVPDYTGFQITVGQAITLDEIKANQIVKNLGTLKQVPYYSLRAQDSGLTLPGFVFWSSYNYDLTDSPLPTGTYSNLSILEINIVPQIVY
jgi:hypothetical protein